MAFDTAVNIVADAAVELGLVPFSSKPTDVFGSTDPNIGQLCQLLKSVGRDLVRERQWTNLQNSWLFSTVANVGLYSLPGDFDRVIDQTGWNRTTRIPLGGPISPQTFEFFKARLVGVTWNILWRVLQGKFEAYPDDATPGSYAIAYEYVSRFWVIPAATQLTTAGPWLPGVSYIAGNCVLSGGNVYNCTIPGKSGTTASLAGTGTVNDGTAQWSYLSAAGTDAPTKNDDVIQLDPMLVRAALKRAFKLEKGLDATGADMDYRACLAKAITADTVAPVLSFWRGNFSEPLLGPANLPVNGTAGQ